MKKVKVILSGALLVSSFGMMAQATTNNLPSQAQDFISEHFSSATLQEVKENSSWEIWEDEKYDVTLSNGVEIDFDENGNVLEIDSQSKSAIPEAALPANIVSYVQSNYPDVQITGWDKKDNGQEVELENGLEIEFDSAGKFQKLD